MGNFNKNTKMTYTGDISIQISNKKPLKFKNSGTINLFRFFADALCGQLQQNQPTLIDITDSDDVNPTSYLTGKITNVVRQPIEETVNNIVIPKASFRFVLLYSNLRSGIGSIGQVKIRLYNSIGVEYANANISPDVLGISSGQQAVIDWKLYVQNKEN